MRSGFGAWVVVLGCLACWSAAQASRVDPSQQQQPGPTQQLSTDPPADKGKGAIDFEDQDPDVKSHWALLVAGSSGWWNYRHQADVYHAYQVLLAGGYHRDHIVVMAADDIAQDPENPMPGKVFNMPGGPDVYDGVRIDYRGADVTAENFLAVLLGDADKMASKGTGRVVSSGPHDKVFVFYSDHGAAGVLGMPNGPFLYADELIKTLKKKHSHNGFKEAVLYIEACESGSMFEGLLDNDLNSYVTTAANAIESSWATYCPTFYGTNVAANDGTTTAATQLPASSSSGSSSGSSSSSFKQMLLSGLSTLQKVVRRITGAPQAEAAAAAATAATAAAVAPTPQFTTCLGDLYSVSWMENAEVSDLTKETLLDQYKAIKVRTSQNFTYEQGSHVMQYGDLEIDHELAGDYEGMLHNGSGPTPSIPSHEWINYAQQRAAAAAARSSSSSLHSQLQLYSSPSFVLKRLTAPPSSSSAHSPKQHHTSTVLQRDADLMPLAAAAKLSHCPRRRKAAAAALARATASREALEGTARAAVAALLKQPGTGYVMMTHLGWAPQAVLPAAHPARLQVLMRTGKQQQQQQEQVTAVHNDDVALLLGDVHSQYVEALMGPLAGREGRPLVDDWHCLRGMVQAWEGQCGQLDQYGMKMTRLFANLCNTGVRAHALSTVLAAGPCAARR